jgi:hypothetical protein
MMNVTAPEGLYSKDINQRLASLTRYVRENERTIENGWINLHVHTNESFSFFKSPTDAVWHAYNENLEYFGINDHYTIAGHDEFRLACEIAHIRSLFSIEAIARDEEAQKKARRYNDPDNPGRIYIIGTGVVRNLQEGSREYRILDTMRQSIRRRNKDIVEKLNRYVESKGYSFKITYSDVESLTPRGNSTERHVVQALCEKIDGIVQSKDEKNDVYTKLLNATIEKKILEDYSELQNLVRAQLVKVGKPCYVEEDRKAFTSIENLVFVHRKYGAIPSYGLMGNPITEEEKDIEALIQKIQSFGMYALVLLELRTELKRAMEIIKAASHYSFPVFIGTEHNWKTMRPLVGEVGKNTELYPYFKKSANFLCGHQLLSELCNFGYLTQDGTPRFRNLKDGFDFFSKIGEMNVSKQTVQEMKRWEPVKIRKYFGI